MKILPDPQGSAAWLKARIGRPTASNFDRIVKPSDGKLSASFPKYLGLCFAEWWLGEPVEQFSTGYMLRGTEMEAQARAWYAWEGNAVVEQTGFILSDCERWGCSPDGLVGNDGGLELKVPALETHVTYLLDDGLSLYKDYKAQVQGCLWITGRAWWDVCSFNPSLPCVRHRVERDDHFIEALSEAVDLFVGKLDALRRKYAQEKAEFDAAQPKRAEASEAAHSF